MAKLSKAPAEAKNAVAMKAIRKALEGLQFGTVTVIVQDGVIVQVDRTSKDRIDYSVLEQVSGGEGI